MKNKIVLFAMLSCLFLIPTALYIIVNINQALYAKYPESITYYKRVADFMGFGWRVKLFYICLGSAITWIWVLLWAWMTNWELFKKGE
jgi:hypothetical protein